MDNSYNYPGSSSPAFSAMSDAILSIAAELSIGAVLEKIVHAARELADARYAALGVPDDRGHFAEFITSGMTSEEWDAIGPLPRTHGLLGAMLETRESYRTRNIENDPRFQEWPDNHPHMKSFLGVPIVSKGKVIAAFYHTDKLDGSEFTQADQNLTELLGAHAAVAIENARLYERSRDLSVMEERNRLAREIHDTLAQGLAAITLQLETADALIETGADIGRVRQVVGQALRCPRTIWRKHDCFPVMWSERGRLRYSLSPIHPVWVSASPLLPENPPAAPKICPTVSQA